MSKVILTIDVEDWFHLLDFPLTKQIKQWEKFPSRIHDGLIRILDECDRAKVKGTFFCLGWIADQYPELIQEIVHRGHEIGTHSYAHQLVYEQDLPTFERDLARSIDSIYRVIGTTPKFYRSPGFSITQLNSLYFEVLSKHGIEVDCSIFPTKRTHGGIENLKHVKPFRIICENGEQIIELPMSVHRLLNTEVVCGGGGYFRLLPFWFIQWSLRKLPYNMTYFHPRDFDKDQPRFYELSKFRYFKTYVGLKSSFHKFQRLLDINEVYDISSYLQKIDVDKIPTLTVHRM